MPNAKGFPKRCLIVTAFLFLGGCDGARKLPQTGNQVGDVSRKEKAEFIEMIQTLPTKGDFFTAEAVERAVPFAPVLLSLTEADLTGHDLYPFLALARGLLDRAEQRAFFTQHFAEIAHVRIKMFVGLVLVDEGVGSEQVIQYMEAALASKERAAILAEMAGPGFNDFKVHLSALANRLGPK